MTQVDNDRLTLRLVGGPIDRLVNLYVPNFISGIGQKNKNMSIINTARVILFLCSTIYRENRADDIVFLFADNSTATAAVPWRNTTVTPNTGRNGISQLASCSENVFRLFLGCPSTMPTKPSATWSPGSPSGWPSCLKGWRTLRSRASNHRWGEIDKCFPIDRIDRLCPVVFPMVYEERVTRFR